MLGSQSLTGPHFVCISFILKRVERERERERKRVERETDRERELRERHRDRERKS